MVKSREKPMLAASRRSTRANTLWKVPIHMPFASSPTRSVTRARISLDALLVNVSARIWLGHARWVAMRYAMRWVSVRVLPLPGPAMIITGPSVVLAASA